MKKYALIISLILSAIFSDGQTDTFHMVDDSTFIANHGFIVEAICPGDTMAFGERLDFKTCRIIVFGDTMKAIRSMMARIDSTQRVFAGWKRKYFALVTLAKTMTTINGTRAQQKALKRAEKSFLKLQKEWP